MYTITFYSYKGGVGRSLLVANCALHLAQLGLRVVVLDLDLEAPGLHYKFRDWLPAGFRPKVGIVDLIDDYATKNELYSSLTAASFEVHLNEPLLEPGEPAPRGRLHVVPAGSAPSLDYWRRVANIDWKRFLYDDGATGVEFFVDLRDRIEAEFSADLLLIDSRTGITEIGNVATSVLADKVICIVTDTPENLEGARAVLRGLRQHRRISDNAPIEMHVAVSRPHSSQPMADRLERIRHFFEEPAEYLDATLVVGAPYPLTYAPEVEQEEHLAVNAWPGQSSQLALDYLTLADEMVPERCWEGIRTAWTPRSKAPYPFCVWNYVWFSLQQAGLPIDGLYRVGRRCYLVVPGFDKETRAMDGKTLVEWFAENKTLGAAIMLTASVPDGAERIGDPTVDDLIELRDRPRTHRQVDAELCLRLPRDFPVFHCTHSDGGEGMVVDVERPLDAGERAVLRKEWASLGYGSTLRLSTRVDPSVRNIEPKYRSMKQGDIDLIPSRRLPWAYSRAVRDLVLQDEERWMSSRHAIYRGELTDPAEVLPAWRKERAARFYVGPSPTVARGAIRLLPFCDHLIMDLPLKDLPGAGFEQLGLSQDEFIALAKERRIIVLLPQAIDRYDPVLLNQLAEQAPESMVFSRTLCAATMIELRRRLYLLFFPEYGLRERYERLHRAWARAKEASLPDTGFDRTAIVQTVAEIWSRAEWHTHDKGAMASFYLGGGLGTLLAEWVRQALKRDLMIESMPAAALVERGAALGAAAVPLNNPEFSLRGLTMIGAALLSIRGEPARAPGTPLGLSWSDGKLSVTELTRLDSEELRRIRSIIAGYLHDGTVSMAQLPVGTSAGNTTAEIRIQSAKFLDIAAPDDRYGYAATLQVLNDLFGEEAPASSEVAKSLPPVVVVALDGSSGAPA